MIITIHQPEFLPYTGFFNRLASADVFIALDDVGYEKNGFINRNKIKTPIGPAYITVPVISRSPNKKINEVLIDNTQEWQKSLLNKISTNYDRSPFFRDYFPFIEDTFYAKWEKISDLDIYLLKSFIKFLGINTKIEKASLNEISGKRTERLVNICKKFRAKTYLSGLGGKNYMDLDLFKNAGIEVIFQNFSQIDYSQQFSEKGFLPNMSIIDLMFNNGKNSLDIIKSGNKNL